jgi:hypothetical protein
VVTNACAFYQCARGCGRAERPAFPAPSDRRVRKFESKPRAYQAARSRSCVWTSLPATNAKRLRKGAKRRSNPAFAAVTMDCFAYARNDVLFRFGCLKTKSVAQVERSDTRVSLCEPRIAQRSIRATLTPLFGSGTPAARTDARPARSSAGRRAAAGSACADRALSAFPA